MKEQEKTECVPFRILHMIGGLNIGGSQTMIINFYQSIDRTKVQFDFMIDHPEAVALVPTVKALGARVYAVPAFKGKNVMEVRRAWNRFFSEHPEYKILHSHIRSYAAVYLPIAKMHGVKTIIHSHSTSNGKGMVAIVKNIMQYPLRYQADYLFSCSDQAGKWLFGKSALKNKKYKKIPNAIDSERFAYDEEKRRKVRSRLGIKDRFVIGHVGRLAEPKNHTFLLEIFADIHKKDRKSCLLLIGDGELKSFIEAKCRRLNIQDSVMIMGCKNKVEDYYMAMDVFVFPSLWEGFSIAVIEAQTAGLQCVISDKLPKEVDVGSGLVHIVKLSENTESWARIIIDQKKKKRMNQACATRNAGYDITESADRLQQFYLECCRQAAAEK